MTLATRCSACGTSFRVVQDQLKVSGGWVRCGRCNEVFNALESLYEIEAQSGAAVVAPPAADVPSPPAPPPATPPTVPAQVASPPASPSFAAAPPQPSSGSGLWARRPAVASPAAAQPSVSPSSTLVQPDAPAAVAAGTDQWTTGGSSSVAPEVQVDPAPGGVPLERGPAESAEPVGAPVAAQPFSQPAWVPFGGVWPSAEGSAVPAPVDAGPSVSSWSVPGADHAPDDTASSTRPAPAQSEPAEWDDRPVHGFEDVETRLEPRPGEDIGATPSFLRHSQRQAALEREGPLEKKWRMAAAALGLLLCLQAALAWRDSLAARLPVLEPLLSLACVPFACAVTAPRNLTALALEGSNLRQRGGVGSGYEISVALRNRSAASVMWPSFELTLTDSQGQALIRRVLTPQDFGVREGRLGPAAEYNLNSLLDVSDRRIAGYTVEIFYP